MGETRNAYNIFVGKPKEITFEETDADGRIVLK
jgi:hypothetical protein